MSDDAKDDDSPSSDQGTLSDCPDDQEKQEPDSDYESYHEGGAGDAKKWNQRIRWIGQGQRIPTVLFDTEAFFNDDPTLKKAGEQFNLITKVTGDSQILRQILKAHGFYCIESLCRRFNLIWTGKHITGVFLRKLSDHHIVNHFPRTEELTRKDKLYKNIIKMQKKKGKEHFDFIPVSFILPSDYKSFSSYFKKKKGLYIVKPVSLSRGRGIYVVDNPKQSKNPSQMLAEQMSEAQMSRKRKSIVSEYIANPLMINGLKFDLRIYVLLTSFDPMVIYVYNEGLTRFATVKYDTQMHDISERYMHLTNYSINMESEDYVKNTDPEVENHGSKWSLGALLRYFRSTGIDPSKIMSQIEDVIIKTILCVEYKVAHACGNYMKCPYNCFELFGFDILLDENFKPWLLEVNLSPSLKCDAPIDIKIKTNMLCDLLNLVGIRCVNPILKRCEHRQLHFLKKFRRKVRKSYGYYYYSVVRDACKRIHRARSIRKHSQAMLSLEKDAELSDEVSNELRMRAATVLAPLSPEEVEIIEKVRGEEQRKGGWMRIFPTSDSWDTYQSFMDFPTTNNLMLHQRLYPERHKIMAAGRSPWAKTVTPSQSLNDLVFKMTGENHESGERLNKSLIESLKRYNEYEKPLKVVPPPAFIQKVEEEQKEKQDGQATPVPSASQNTPSSQNEKEAGAKINVKKHEEQASSVSEVAKKEKGIKEQADVTKELKHQGQESHTKVLPSCGEPCQPCHVSFINDGFEMSAHQARLVFAAYLFQVLKKLAVDNDSSQTEETEFMNAMVNQVLRFLRNASAYLPHTFSHLLPKNASALHERRGILAKQLGDFLLGYTTLIDAWICGAQKNEKKYCSCDGQRFEAIINCASLAELHELLMIYSKSHDIITTFFRGGGDVSTKAAA